MRLRNKNAASGRLAAAGIAPDGADLRLHSTPNCPISQDPAASFYFRRAGRFSVLADVATRFGDLRNWAKMSQAARRERGRLERGVPV